MQDDAKAAREYVSRISEEIQSEARRRREADPQLVAREREISQAWAGAVPNAAAVGRDTGRPSDLQAHEEHLLDGVDSLSLIDVDAPVGERAGVRRVKHAVQRLTRWYLRYLADQINAFNHFLVNLLRVHEQRITRIEGDARAAAVMGRFVDPVPEADAVLAEAVADLFADRVVPAGDGPAGRAPVAVVSCGTGRIVSALLRAGVAAHGVDESAELVGDGVDEGLDLRVATPTEHLARIADGSLAGVVLTGSVERLGPVELSSLIDESLRCVEPTGRIVVAVADLLSRPGPEAELLRGVGLSADTWAHLLACRGCVVESSSLDGSRVTTLVTARRQ